MSYDPCIAALCQRAEEDWGNPEDNRGGLVLFGVPPLDKALYGLDCRNGELIGIQADEKERKSTFLANLIYNVASQRRFWCVVDTLESGMNPIAYRDTLIAMGSTWQVIARLLEEPNRHNWPKAREILENPEVAPHVGISREFLWYSKRTGVQMEAIDLAKRKLSELPIMLFGVRPEEGQANDLASTMHRWEKLYNGSWPIAKGKFARMFAVDHVQQLAGWPGDDYGKLENATEAYARFVNLHPGSVVIAVSQVSATSRRLAKQGMGKRMAKGGAKLAAEINILFETEYDREGDPYSMLIRTAETRRRPAPLVRQEIDPESGAFLRPGYRAVC